MVAANSDGWLRDYFSGLTEHAFHIELGVADPPLTEYLAEMLTRFLHTDSIFRARDVVGKRLGSVADMVTEAEQRSAAARKALHQHIGDFTLFWSGLYPEMLKRLRAVDQKDFLIDYAQQGKRSYYIASTTDGELDSVETEVLFRLSDQYEVCREALEIVRREWRTAAGESGFCEEE